MTTEDVPPDTGSLTRRVLRTRADPAGTPTSAATPDAATTDAAVPDAATSDAGPASDDVLAEERAALVSEPAADPEDSVDPDFATDTVEAVEEPTDAEAVEETTGPEAVEEATGAEAVEEATGAEWADDRSPATALTWVDAAAVAAGSTPASLDAPGTAESGPGILAGARMRPAALRPGVLVPLGILAGLVASYAGTTLLWPLTAVPPSAQAIDIEIAPAPPATVTWPAQGGAAIAVGGIGTLTSTADRIGIASITKVVTSLMVLDRMPLAAGEQGPEFAFTRADARDYWAYRRSNQSALDVPVGGTLTQYQMLQGTLLGSANNYIDRLADEIWGSDAAFAEAAEIWLRDRGIDGIRIVTPSGFDERNESTPAALVEIAERAMANPVLASIVGLKSVELPGAGLVKNTNGMLADKGVVGVKTGTLEAWNLLTAKDITVGDTTVHLFASVLGQGGNDARLAATRSLFAETEAALQAQPTAVPRGTVVGEVRTEWGATVEIVTDADADVVLWNSAKATASAEFALGDKREAGTKVGTLTTSGPLNQVETTVSLAEELPAPSAWWRLTHPMQLLGIDGD